MAVPAPAQKLLDFIASYEAPHGYDTVYGNKMARMPKRLSGMTIDEAIQQGPWRTKSFGSSACGRYQFMTATLASLKSDLHLTGAEVMTPTFQDRLGYELLLRRGYAEFAAGTKSVVAFGLAVAQEWASFPVLSDTPVYEGKGENRKLVRFLKRGQSYYAGDGLNHVLVGADAVETVLTSLRAMPATVTAPPAMAAPAADRPRVVTVPAPAAPKVPWWARLVGVKRPAAPVDRPGLHPNGDPALWDVQKVLRDKVYYTKGLLDGLDGGITQSAVAQARKDNGLGDGGIDAAFLALLPTMPARPVSAERATLTVAKAAEHVPELFGPLKWLGGLGVGAIGLGGADGSGLLDGVQTTVGKANDVFGSVQTAVGYVGGAVGFVVEHRTLFLIAGGLFLVAKAIGYGLDAWIKVRAAFF